LAKAIAGHADAHETACILTQARPSRLIHSFIHSFILIHCPRSSFPLLLPLQAAAEAKAKAEADSKATVEAAAKATAAAKAGNTGEAKAAANAAATASTGATNAAATAEVGLLAGITKFCQGAYHVSGLSSVQSLLLLQCNSNNDSMCSKLAVLFVACQAKCTNALMAPLVSTS
jgi:hypothetical protein